MVNSTKTSSYLAQKFQTKTLKFFLFLCLGGCLLSRALPVQGAKIVDQPGVTGVSQAAAPDPDAGVSIDFEDVDIAVFIKFISELTGKNFVVDTAVKGKVTVISPTKISVDEAYRVLEAVLEVHGYTTVPAGEIIKIIPAGEARSKSVETRLRQEALGPQDKVVTQIIPLLYADPDELKALLAPLVSKNSVIVSYPPAGMLIVTDVRSNIERLLRIIQSVDVEGAGAEIAVIPLRHAPAATVAKSLNAVFERIPAERRKRAAAASVRVVPDRRTNALVVLASEAEMLKIKKLIRLLDREIPRGKGNIHVYYLQHANAEDLAEVLSTIATQQTAKIQQGKAPVISKAARIVADQATNSLVITADKEDYAVLEEVIKQLDIARRMVYIEALIMEVSVNKQFDIGVEWHAADQIGSYEGRKIGVFGGSGSDATVSPTIDPATGNVRLPSGFSIGVLGEGISIGGVKFPTIGAVARAFQQDSDANILSTPQILTTDNEEAEIKVGKNIPFLTRQETSTADIDYSSYEYKDVGVTLNILPQINQERFVFLKLSQEVTQVVQEESALGLPTTLKRSAKTAVVVKDGQTLVIGGLIDENLGQGTYQVPCLGNIPALGWLFSSISHSRSRTNLFVFLTTHIIENQAEAREIYDEKKMQMERLEEGVIKLYDNPQPRPARQ